MQTYAPRPKSRTFFLSADILLVAIFEQFPIVFWYLVSVDPKFHMPVSNVYQTAKVLKVGKVRFKRPPTNPILAVGIVPPRALYELGDSRRNIIYRQLSACELPSRRLAAADFDSKVLRALHMQYS